MRFDFDRDYDSCIEMHGNMLAREYDLYALLVETNKLSVRCEVALVNRECYDYYFMEPVYNKAKLEELKGQYDQKSYCLVKEIEYFADLRLIMFDSLCGDLEKYKLENAELKAKLAQKQEDVFVAPILPMPVPKMPLNFPAAAAAAENSEERDVKKPILGRIKSVLGKINRKK